MVTIKLNITPVVNLLQAKLGKLADKEYLLRPVAFDVIDLMTKRIHIDGIASDGNQIGQYSKGYLALRSGVFQNSDRFKKGTQKGNVKNAGNHSKGASEGKARPSYHRGTDPKVIISLTRQLENDYNIIATQRGYGIGFLNPLNYKKSQWVQATYKKKIFNLTVSEYQFAINKVNELTTQALQ